jgi:hypothetical protein
VLELLKLVLLLVVGLRFSEQKLFRAGSVINRFSSTSNVSSRGGLPVTPREMAMESVSPSILSPRLQEREIMSLDETPLPGWWNPNYKFPANKKVLHPNGQKEKPPTPIFSIKSSERHKNSDKCITKCCAKCWRAAWGSYNKWWYAWQCKNTKCQNKGTIFIERSTGYSNIRKHFESSNCMLKVKLEKCIDECLS